MKTLNDGKKILEMTKVALERSKDSFFVGLIDFHGTGESVNMFRPKLTKREDEVVNLISKGYSNKEISNKLCIAESTAKRHVHSILSKFGIKNRTLLIVYIGNLEEKD